MEDDIENQIADIANTVANMMREHLAEKLFAIPQNLKDDMSCVSMVAFLCKREICKLFAVNQASLLK